MHAFTCVDNGHHPVGPDGRGHGAIEGGPDAPDASGYSTRRQPRRVCTRGWSCCVGLISRFEYLGGWNDATHQRMLHRLRVAAKDAASCKRALFSALFSAIVQGIITGIPFFNTYSINEEERRGAGAAAQ